MRVLLHLSLLALGAAYVCAIPTESPMSTLVKETLALLSTHRALLIDNETLRIPVPVHKHHELCTEEIFQGIDTLKNQTEQENAVEKLFQNLSAIKNYIDLQKVKKVWRRKTESKAIHRLPARVSWCDKHRMDNRTLR
ncbi:interleukin-5 isoform X1 [Carlito syrichta]|uniref:Interleukin-5 n=1 Tax=Carlito syrichta TaxID=1868482 RepID=A0A1U7TPY9_CARSF|nr:interleukin-5 isoform X1 [Carlito syrichta]